MNSVSIGRGWSVVTADGKRVGDVVEVHEHYLLVSRGVFMVKDLFLPLGSVDRAEGGTVTLTISQATLREMDLRHIPPAPEPAAPLHDPEPAYEAPDYTMAEGTPPGGGSDEPLAFPGAWEGGALPAYEETPSYTRPQPNGLIEVDIGVNLAVQDLGYGQPILLAPGWPFDGSVWEPLPAILAQEQRVIVVDPRGTGGSDHPWDFYGVENLTQDLHRVIVEQAIRDVTLVAWSTAAVVALRYAREHLDRVARLVLLAPLILPWLAADDAAERFGGQPELDGEAQQAWSADLLADRPVLFERLVDRLTAAPVSAPRRHWLWQRLMHGAHHAQVKTWEDYRQQDPAEWLAEIEAPVTIIAGEQDRLAPPAMALRLAELLPRAQCVTLSDCGHAVFLDQRDAVLQALRDLVAPLYQPEEPAMEAEEGVVDETTGGEVVGEPDSISLNEQPSTS